MSLGLGTGIDRCATFLQIARMPRKDGSPRFESDPLFSVAGIARQLLAKKFKAPGLPVWTECKARLIERYLH